MGRTQGGMVQSSTVTAVSLLAGISTLQLSVQWEHYGVFALGLALCTAGVVSATRGPTPGGDSAGKPARS